MLMINPSAGKLRTARPGYALVTVVVFLAACILLGATVYGLTRAEMQSSVYQAKKTAAFYAAEAGVQDALQFASTSTWTQGFTNKKFMEGFYTVKFDTATNPVTLTSQGWVRGSSPGKTVKAMVTVRLAPHPGIFDYALGATIGSIELRNNSVVNGNMFSSGGYNFQGNADVNGSTTNVVPPPVNPVIPKPSTPCNYVSSATTLGPCYVDGDLSITINHSVALTGTLFVTGKLTMENNTALVGCLPVYVGGDFYMSNNAILGDSTTVHSPFIYAPGPGTVTINNNGASSNAVVYAPNRNITLTNNAIISGSIIGNSNMVINNAIVTYVRVTLPAGLDLGVSGLGWIAVTNSWEEKY